MELLINNFSIDKSRHSGYRERCRSCQKIMKDSSKKFYKTCQNCNIEFPVIKSDISNERKKFCSKRCNRIHNNTAVVKSIKTHGMSETHFYKKWSDIQYRCSKIGYKNYQERGIKNLWKSFESFKNDMYDLYLDHVKENGETNTTIERIDVNGDYSRQNCKWVTQKLQQRNRRNNINITFSNKTQCMSAWAEEFNISPKTLWWRLKNGWSINKALSK